MSRALGMGSELSSQADLLQGYVELYHHGLLHVKSAALGCAVGLGIPTAIHRGGGAATAPDLAADAGVDPAKLPYLRRLMRALTVSGVFATSSAGGVADEPVFTLTPVSRLLVVDERSAADGMSAMLRLLVRPSTSVATFFSLEAWFRDAGAGSAATTMTLFETAHGVPAWSMTKSDVAYNKALNDGCAADSSFAMDVILKEAVVEGGNNIFAGLSSLVDVGGGHGAAAVAITRAFPHIKCSVLDLEQVIREAPDDGTVRFIAGDMFQSVPPADAVLLKFILHCWDDGSCVKILRQCKRAIPSRDAGGKVIIMNMVVGYGEPDPVVKETQVLFDMFMMRYSGAEREEHEWKRIFLEAGFSDYKITPILGFLSIIEVFP